MKLNWTKPYCGLSYSDDVRWPGWIVARREFPGGKFEVYVLKRMDNPVHYKRVKEYYGPKSAAFRLSSGWVRAIMKDSFAAWLSS